jgi:2-polyprenyl-3-methyl-5-hydroxy-6-metoxy-1,4-benzoquinol methylase
LNCERVVLSKVVREYYDKHAEKEWGRLVQDAYHRLEFIVTMHFLEKYLPKRGLILDAGGGPGRYTVELARKGYDIVLLDLSPECLKVAETKIRSAGAKNRVKSVMQCSITDMAQFSEESFDAVICLGALSHLVKKEDRDSAARELVRVAKMNGPIFISVINLYGVFRVVLQRLPYELLLPSHKEMFCRGIHRAEWHKDEPYYQGFPDAYFFLPPELQALFEKQEVETLEMATCEGLSAHLKQETNEIYRDKKKWKFWLDLILKTCTDPAILGLGEHFLYVGKKIA